MASSLITRYVMILLMIILCISSSDAFQPKTAMVDAVLPKITVEIVNKMPNMILVVHCKSKTDDLGEHQIPFQNDYTFQFRPNVLPTTLYFCSMAWPGSTLHYFDVYVEKRDTCTYCSWHVLRDGACLFDPNTQKYEGCIPWNK
ncbi:Plant self-incompatibility protein S1 family [Quillaja saponaria]|uniref:S-protein homolog n=1 Tax=Quillaja saponaria TaxID=32244 RepID=A0AAD7VLD2_QUISA|nr:Plant self-incompatibility protein S1 family [Quillaja saponaria]